MSESLNQKMLCKMLNFHVVIPTWITLYINVALASVTMILGDGGDLVTYSVFPFSNYVLPVVLIIACFVSLHGLLTHNTGVLALGAITGFGVWMLDIIAFFVNMNGFSDPVTLTMAPPMIVYFSFLYIKYSVVHNWEKQKGVKVNDDIF